MKAARGEKSMRADLVMMVTELAVVAGWIAWIAWVSTMPPALLSG